MKRDLKDFVNILDLYDRLSGTQTDRSKSQVYVKSLFDSDTTPSMSINAEKGVFKCHKTGIQGDIYNMAYGDSNPIDEFRAVKEYIADMFSIDLLDLREYGQLQEKRSYIDNTNYVSWDFSNVWTNFNALMDLAYHRPDKRLWAILHRWLGNYETPIPKALVKSVALSIGWDPITNSLAIPYFDGDKVSYIELVRYSYGKKVIQAYPTKFHLQSDAHIEMNQSNDGFMDALEKKRLSSDRICLYKRSIKTIDIKQEHRVLICEGVKDALIASCHGFVSVACHGGAKALSSYKNNRVLRYDLEDKDVCIIYDNDQSGRDGAKALHQLITDQYECKSVNIIDLSSTCTAQGDDLTDYFLKYRKTPDDLIKLIDERV